MTGTHDPPAAECISERSSETQWGPACLRCHTMGWAVQTSSKPLANELGLATTVLQPYCRRDKVFMSWGKVFMSS